MDTREAIVFLLCVTALVVCGWSLWRPMKHQLFGSEAIRLRLRFSHWLVMFGSALALLGMILARNGVTVSGSYSANQTNDPVFLSLATVLVLFMLFGFVGFEAGGVSSAYRNESAEKNLLVMMFSLAAYLGIGCRIHDSFFALRPTFQSLASKSTGELMGIVFQAGFACTVSLIISNALTERASRPANVLCAVFSAGLGYPLLAGLTWGDMGLLHQIGFVDASGANAVHLLGAAASLTAVAMVGPRVRLQRWRFLGGPETPDFRSPWTIFGGLFLFFGWLGFNSGNAPSALHGHAFLNTAVGACSGALAAWTLSRVVGLFKRRTRAFERAESEQTTLRVSIEDRPRIVIGMMGGLVAVTANGYLSGVRPWMAVLESAVGGLVAVLVSTWMALRSRSGQIDDPLGVIGTHGCAAIVGLLSTALWLAYAEAHEGIPILQHPPMPFWSQLAAHLTAQLIGCGVCIVVGWLVAMVPCWLLLLIESRALVGVKVSWWAAKFRLRLGAIEQLGTPHETPQSLTPQDQVWKYRVEAAARRIIDGVEGDSEWWKAVKTYAKAAELLDISSQAKIAQRIVKKLQDTADQPDRERVALVALGSSAEFKADDIRSALTECLTRAESNGNGHAGPEAPNGAQPSRKEWLVWGIASMTERAAVLNEAGITNLLPQVNRGLDYLRKATKSDKNYMVQYHARNGVIDSNFVLRYYEDIPPICDGSFDRGGQWKTVYALVANKTALPMLLFLADRGPAMIAVAAEEFKRTPEDMLETAKILESHGLLYFDAQRQKMTIKDAGLQLVKRLRRSRARA